MKEKAARGVRTTFSVSLPRCAALWRRVVRSSAAYRASLLFLLLAILAHPPAVERAFAFFASAPVYYEAATHAELPGESPALLARNNPEPGVALGGGDIIVDGDHLVPGGPFGDDVFARDGAAGGEISIYTVREGDSLSEIAAMFDVTTNTIMWANNMDNPTISPGDELVILPIVGVRHVVKSGDTIDDIADKYDGDAAEILEFNQLASASAITPGETLIIPGGNLHRSTPDSAPAAPSPVATTPRAQGGYFSHPLPGGVRTQGIHGYNAVDLAAAAGTPIRAAASGEVIVARAGGWNGGYGTYLVLKHDNGTQTLYAHNSSNAVGVGAYVSTGEVIGYVGNTGRSTGPHLHFEVRGARNPF